MSLKMSLLIVGAVVLAACSSSAASDTTDSSVVSVSSSTSTTVAPDTTTSAVATTTTTPPTTVPPTTEPPTDVVGDPEALQAFFDEAEASVKFINPEYDGSLQVPDLTTPDPVEAVVNAVLFDVAVSQTQPDPDWVDIYTVQGSQADRVFRQTAQIWAGSDIVIVVPEPGFQITEAVEVDLAVAEDEIPADDMVEARTYGDLRAVRLTEVSPPYDVIYLDDRVLVDSYPGIDMTKLFLVTPTVYGWQLVWFQDE